jgi:adenylylsulfate kinase
MLANKSPDVVWQHTEINKERRNKLNQHKSAILWFTGLSGSGKSTVANELEKILHQLAIRTFILDGDNIRHGLSKDLAFSDDDRRENIRRIGEVAKLFIESGTMTLTTFISPFRIERDSVRHMVKRNEYIEIYVKCSLDVCEERDVKGLYKKARNGEIKKFTGIDSPYEEPTSAEIVVDTSSMTTEKCVNQILYYMISTGLIKCRRQADRDILLKYNYYKYFR